MDKSRQSGTSYKLENKGHFVILVFLFTKLLVFVSIIQGIEKLFNLITTPKGLTELSDKASKCHCCMSGQIK